MKKRTKITSIILASVLAVSAVGTAATAAFIDKYSNIDISECETMTSKYYNADEAGEDYEGFFDLTPDEQEEQLRKAAKDAVVITDLQDKISEGKKLAANYFKDVAKIDYDEKIEKIPVKTMKLPDGINGLALDGTIYINSMSVDEYLDNDAIADEMVPYVLHETIHLLSYQDEIDAETGLEYVNQFYEDITEYITRQAEDHGSCFYQDSSAYHPEYIEELVSDDPDLVFNYLNNQLTSDEMNVIENYMQTYYAE